VAGKTGDHINDHLSELIETTVEDLEKAKCVTVEEDDIIWPANLGRIADHYYLKYQTIDLFAQAFEEETSRSKRLKQILDLVARAAEFEQVPVRQGEDSLLKSLPLEHQVEGADKFNEPHIKTNVLLQSHFSRTELTIDLNADLKLILTNAVKLIHALADVVSSHGHLKPALYCLELSQMVVQAMWPKDSVLLQLPHFDQGLVDVLSPEGVQDLADLMNMDDKKRNEIL